MNKVAVKTNNGKKEKKIVIRILRERKYVGRIEKKNRRKYRPTRKRN